MATSISRPVALVAPDEQAWDTFVESHPHGHLLQLTAWGALKNAFGWEARRIAVSGPEGLLAGAQVLIRRKYGFAAAYIPRGPLLSGDPAIDDLLFHGLRRSLRNLRVVFVRIEPNIDHHDPKADALHTGLALRGWRQVSTLQPRSTLQLDITPDLDTLFAAFSKGHRADIRRAERQGVSIRAGNGPTDLDAFFVAMQATTARKSDYAIHSIDYYRRAWELFAAQGRAQLLLAEVEGATVGTCMVFAGGGQGLYLYGGSNEVGLKKGANHLLQWHALQWAKAHGCTSYDFWGIPDALGRAAIVTDDSARERLQAEAQSDPLNGVYRFKKGFGGTVVRFLPAYDQVYVPFLYALWRRQEA